MHWFKSAILAKMKNCQNGTFEPVQKIWFFLAKSNLLKQYENDNKKNFHNMSQGPPNPGFAQEKVQKGDFLKKLLWELKNYLGSYESLEHLEG